MTDQTPSVKTIIKFDGPAVENKSMDVDYLAPALLSLSELIKETNRMVNGDRADIKIAVSADLEQNCFELIIDLSTQIWDTTKTLLSDDDVKTAKEIAEWVGIIVGGSSVIGIGFYQLIKKLKGKNIKATSPTITNDGKNIVQIQIEGDGNSVNVSQNVYDIYASPSAREKAVKVLAPLRKEGYETITFHSNEGENEKEYITFNKDEIPNQAGTDLPEVAEIKTHTSEIRTGVRIKKAVYEGNTAWTLVYKKTIQATIFDKGWLSDFQNRKISAPPKSSLDVTLKETYRINDDGEIVGQANYTVLEVHKVISPHEQQKI